MPKNQREKIRGVPLRTLVVGTVKDAALVMSVSCAACDEMREVYSVPLAQVLGSNPVLTGLLASGMLDGRSFNVEFDGTFYCIDCRNRTTHSGL